MGFVVFIVCCHFISLYYLPWEGLSLLLQAVQKALSRLILSFCKDNHFFWESILLLLFFFSFSLPRLSHSLPWLLHSVPWLLHSLPRLSHSVPRLSHSLPWFCCHIPLSNVCPTHPTCRGRSFKKMPGVLKLLPLQGALLIALYPGRCPGLWASAPSGRAACVFCPANCLIPRALPWAVSFCPFRACCLRLLQRKSVHILGFSVTKGSPFYVICDVLVNTCEGRVHALNPLCLSGFRRRCEGWTLVSYFRTHTRKENK